LKRFAIKPLWRNADSALVAICLTIIPLLRIVDNLGAAGAVRSSTDDSAQTGTPTTEIQSDS